MPYAGVYCPCCCQSQLTNNDCQIDLATSGDWQKYYIYPAEGMKGLKGYNEVTELYAYSGCSPSQ